MKKRIPLIIIGLIIMTGIFSGCESTNKRFNKMFDVYVTDAPFGKYWVHTWGKAVLFSGSDTYSELKETYTIKFMDGDELNTVILDSTDYRLHVHFTNNNLSMTFNVQYENTGGYDSEASHWRDYMNGGGAGGEWWSEYRFDLFIPRPELCQISNETTITGSD